MNIEEKAKAKIPEQPSRPRIREQRHGSAGLLILYPLNPEPFYFDQVTKKKERKKISSYPIIGVAVSFPAIEHDEKIEYAVNEQFLNEYDYPDELDLDDENEGTD
jgi:hypothetical protein